MFWFSSRLLCIYLGHNYPKKCQSSLYHFSIYQINRCSTVLRSTAYCSMFTVQLLCSLAFTEGWLSLYLLVKIHETMTIMFWTFRIKVFLLLELNCSLLQLSVRTFYSAPSFHNINNKRSTCYQNNSTGYKTTRYQKTDLNLYR